SVLQHSLANHLSQKFRITGVKHDPSVSLREPFICPLSGYLPYCAGEAYPRSARSTDDSPCEVGGDARRAEGVSPSPQGDIAQRQRLSPPPHTDAAHGYTSTPHPAT